MMNTLAGMGLAGSAVMALWLPASKVLKDRMPARWHYCVLKISLFFFLVPVGRQLGIRGPVELRENPAARSPFAAGLLRPAVVIPAADLEREELRYLFLHELTHIQCGDL